MERKFPNYFKVYRKKHGLGQKQLAELIGKSRFHLNRLEQGECLPSLQTAMIYSILFGAEVSDLMPEFDQYLRKLLNSHINTHRYLFKDKKSLGLIKERLSSADCIDENKPHNHE